MSRAVGAALGLVAALLIGSCASGAQPTVTSTPTHATADATSALLRAVERTAALGNATLTVEVLTTVDGLDDALSGQGVVALDGASGEMSWTSGAGDSVERRTPDGVFVQLDPPDGGWLIAPDGTATSGALAPLVGLDELTEVRAEGDETLSIGPTRRFTGSLPADGHEGALGLNPTAAEAVTSDEQSSIDVTVWVDADGHIRRVMRTLRTSVPVSAATFSDLLEFGTPLHVRTPEGYETAT